jgi:hypothetical protein
MVIAGTISSAITTPTVAIRLVGRWTWAGLVRRPVLAVFSAVFRFQQAADGRLFDIWPSVRRELLTAVGLAPLLVAFLDDPFFDRVLAADASSQGLGVTATRAGALTGQVSSIAAAIPARPVPSPSDGTHTFPRPAALPPPLDAGNVWSPLVSSPWRRVGDHINVLELRAIHTALRWALSCPASVGTRLLVLSDSTVCVYALSKGRSSSLELLPRIRAVSACQLAAGISLVPRWVPTDLNPADGPSRLRR